MVARMVRRQLQPTSVAAFPRTLAKNILPLLRTQSGFQDEDRVVMELISLVHTWPCVSESESDPRTCSTAAPAAESTGEWLLTDQHGLGRGFPIQRRAYAHHQ